MKLPPPLISLLVIGFLVLGAVTMAGCTTSEKTATSIQPVFDTSVTTAPVTQPQGAAQNVGSANCRSGLTDCSGFCRDLSVDIGNCGSCGVSCPSGQACTNGQCMLTCSKGKTVCGSTCADLTSDPKNCGSCGIACPSGQVCNDGQCGVKCINKLIFCNGQCRDLSADSANCGACGIACPSGQACQQGQCGAMCGSGQTFCNGYCRNLYTDSANCGSCGVSCAAGSSCQNGQCTAAAPPVANVAGAWNCRITSPFTMTLSQSYTSVSGNYAGKGSITSGSVSLNSLTAQWNWDNSADYGTVTFSISGSSLDGTATSSKYPANAASKWTCTR